jgi:hypothetical protein
VDRAPAVVVAVIAGLSVAALGACSDDDAGSGGACGPVRREAVDPASSVHVVSGDEPAYQTDPPTSGPHAPAPVLSGVRDEPLDRPTQVGQLEAGGVLLQYRPDLDAAQLAELAGLAGDAVVVVPNPDLPAAVVATAWVTKQTCDAVDVDQLGRFVAEHRDAGSGTDG